MPQAAGCITVGFDTPATGIFAYMSRSRGTPDLIDEAHCRLDQIAALLNLLKNGQDLNVVEANAFAALETMVEDAAALLSVVSVEIAA